MDNKTTIKEIREKVRKMRDDRRWHTGPRAAAVSICIEAAELLEHFQWDEDAQRIIDGPISKEKREDIESEVADILVYLADFANNLDIDLSAALDIKLKKIDEKYPVDKILSEGDNFYFSQKKKYRQNKK